MIPQVGLKLKNNSTSFAFTNTIMVSKSFYVCACTYVNTVQVQQLPYSRGALCHNVLTHNSIMPCVLIQ